MDVTIARVRAANVGVLDNVDAECFDEPIDRQRAARCVASDDVVLVVALAEAMVVGQCLAMVHRHPDKETELYIDDLAVSPAFRRRGVGRRLVEACAHAGREAGADSMWVGTEPDNEDANAFYQALRLARRTAVLFEGALDGDRVCQGRPGMPRGAPGPA